MAVVRTTTGGNLFPLFCLAENGILSDERRAAGLDGTMTRRSWRW